MEELKKLVKSIRPELCKKGLKGSGSTESLREEEASTVDDILDEEKVQDGKGQAKADPDASEEVPPPPPAPAASVPDPLLDQTLYPDNQLGLEPEVAEDVKEEMEAHEEQAEIASPAKALQARQAFKDRRPLFELPDIATLTRDHLQKYFPELTSLESTSYDMVTRLLLEAGVFFLSALSCSLALVSS